MCLDECFPNLSAKDSSELVNIRKIIVDKFEYNSSVFGFPDNADIIGYFQSEKYFKDFRDSLLKEFEFKQEINAEAEKIKNKFQNPLITVHLRLGDYRHLENKHPICSKEYYLNALEQLPKDTTILAFSDEPNLAKETFDLLNRKYELINSNSQYIDMCLMSKCQYHVLANSSFSWWGSWLSNSIKTIAPKNWFGLDKDMPKDWSDIYCKDWVII
jgi:hypothetical protein